MKEKKGLLLLLTVLGVLLIGVMGARPLYNLYRDVSFAWVEHSPAELEIKAYADANDVSYGEYPQAIIDLYETNPETREFVLNYPFRQKQKADLTAYAQSSAVPLFLQWDPMWGYTRYGGSFLAITGCGPTCLAMAGYYLTGDASMTPDQIAGFAQREGYYRKGSGSSWTLISQGAEKLGLHAQELPLVKKKITDALESGNPVILAMGPGDFTTSGHYIVLTAVENGSFRVNDPNSRLRSQRLWSYEELEGQIRNIWAISA